MRNALLAATVVTMLCGAAYADFLVDPKWSQKPDEGIYGYDFSSETLVPSAVADDFLCDDPLPVTYLHWWGSYWCQAPLLDKNSDTYTDPSFAAGLNQPPVMPTVVTAFSITFYADVSAGVDPTMPHSHPGTLLLSQDISIAQVATNLHAIVDRDENGDTGDIGDETIWQYNVELPVPFDQTPGTTYWVSIVAKNDSGNPTNIQWGWHESYEHELDNAVQHGPAAWGPEYNVEWANLAPKDMAFELAVPEPATMALVTGGLALMGLSRRRRRR